MIISEKYKSLKIFVSENDKIGHIPVYEKIVVLAQEKKLSGTTVIKGIMGYGKHSAIHSSKLLSISEDLPIIIEIIETEEKINNFLKELELIFNTGKFEGIITLENVDLIKLT